MSFEQDLELRGREYAQRHDLALAEQLGAGVHGIVFVAESQPKVPQLIRYDDALLAIEMTVVTRPFVLDFAGAFLDRPPDFSEEVVAEWRAEKQDQFGKRWREAEGIVRELESYGIYMIDVSPNNISLPGTDP
jgi:hypothetical protein